MPYSPSDGRNFDAKLYSSKFDLDAKYLPTKYIYILYSITIVSQSPLDKEILLCA